MTECTQSRLPFANHGSREVVAEFSGGTMTSDSGALLLRETDGRMKLLARFSQCFLDARNPALVQHPVEQMLAQRIYALALGYEDLNDQRATAAGSAAEVAGRESGSERTISRQEHVESDGIGGWSA